MGCACDNIVIMSDSPAVKNPVFWSNEQKKELYKRTGTQHFKNSNNKGNLKMYKRQSLLAVNMNHGSIYIRTVNC